MDTFTWEDLKSLLQVGAPVRYWAPVRGYSGATFNVTQIHDNRIDLTTKKGEPIEVYQKDFEKVSALLLQGVKSSSELTKISGRTAYIQSFLQELRERREQPKMKLGDLLSPNSRVFLKSEYGPVSNEWPAVSFSHEDYARELGEIVDQREDLVLFVGTDDRDLTAKEFRKRLLCVSRVRSGAPVDSGVLVDPQSLNFFQRGNPKKFAYSLQVQEAWSLTALPAARDLVKATYGVIGRGKARKSYLSLSSEGQ